MNVRICVAICGTLTAANLCAQNSYPVGTVYFNAKDYAGFPVVDAPFCGERRNVGTVTQPDGTQKTLEYAPSKVCRDSAGRTRNEHPIFLKPGGPQVGPLFIGISDPVAHAKYVVYEVNKTVYRQELPAARTLHPPVGVFRPAGSDLVGSVENLGTQTIEGLLVEGHWFVRKIPALQERNDANFTRTFEDWWSPELGEFVLEKSSDAVKGEIVHTLFHISREEPDPDLFRLPPDYAVVDEAGDFTILWGSDSGARAVETPGH